MSVIGRDVSLDRCLVTIFLQDLVGGIGIHAHLVNVNPALRTCLDPHDGEDVAVKAGSVNPYHVGESLPNGAGEYKMIPPSACSGYTDTSRRVNLLKSRRRANNTDGNVPVQK